MFVAMMSPAAHLRHFSKLGDIILLQLLAGGQFARHHAFIDGTVYWFSPDLSGDVQVGTHTGNQIPTTDRYWSGTFATAMLDPRTDSGPMR